MYESNSTGFINQCVIEGIENLILLIFYLCSNTKMATEKQQLPSAAAAAAPPAASSCRKKKSDDATFLQDVKDHIDEFIHASMEEHKNCFKKSISKVCLGSTFI